MNRPAIAVDIVDYLADCPPYDNPIDTALIPAIADEIARRFDSTEIYSQIDEHCCAILRDTYNIDPSA